MNRIIVITILLLAVAAQAQETNTVTLPPPEPVTLQSLALKNIFDPTRSGRGRPASRPRPKIIRTFTFRGTVDDAALFTGEGVGKGTVKRGDTLNGFKVMKVPLNYDDAVIVLTDPTGVIVALKDGESMRREEDGPWTKSDEAPPESTPATVSSTTTEESSGPHLTGAAPESDILKRLRLKREQEEK